MHVAIVGAGALGRAFGVRLAHAKVAVDFVVRAGGDGAAGAPIRLEEVGGDAWAIEAPSRVTSVPAHADVVLICVRGDQLGGALLDGLRTVPNIPVVAFTPMLPRTHERLRAELGARFFCALTNVTAYTRPDGVTRSWRARSTPMLLDEPRAKDAAVTALVDALDHTGVETRLVPGVHETVAATLLLFLPIALGLDAAGSIEALLEDEALSTATFEAGDEGRALAERCGEPALWAGVLTRFLGPRMIRVGLSLARSRAAEAMAFVEGHFGRAMHAQNLALGDEARALAAAKGTRHEALDALLARLRQPAA